MNMHIYFSGIGGTGIGPLALIAHQAGFEVSGSDAKESYIIDYLKKHDLTDIHIGQSYDQIARVHKQKPIDWFVYTSALTAEQSDAPELRFCSEHNIRTSLRDEFLQHLLLQTGQRMLAIAGTHGKTTTTAMAIWLCKKLGMPVSYSVGGKLSFGAMGEFNPRATYFIYEADEYNRNFLAFRPALGIITGVDWDHPDIYPTRESYNQAFLDFIAQSEQTIIWQDDASRLALADTQQHLLLDENNKDIDQLITLPGHVNRLNAWQVAQALQIITGKPLSELIAIMNEFPGVSRRFEQLRPGLYTDYAHTPPKIRGALQTGHETAGDNVVVVYEGLHNTRQHFIKSELKHLFDDVKQLYIVPSYLAREDPDLPLLSPEHLRELLSDTAKQHAQTASLDDKLATTIRNHLEQGDLVLCLTAGGGGSLDEWLRKTF